MFKLKKILLPLLAAIMLSLPLVANAQDFSSLTPIIQNSFQFFNIILIAFQALLWPILLLLGGLLNNDLLFSGGMQTVLLNIWSAVRDFVNVMFVLGLLGVAVYNIIGIGNNENYSVKKALPKIAIALIAVNFSFLACKVVLDVVNVTTTAIFAMPMASDSLKKYNDPAELEKLSDAFCNKITNLSKKNSGQKNPYCDEQDSSKSSGASKSPASGQSQPAAKDSAATVIKGKLNNLGKSFFSSFNSRNVALVMAIELMDIANIDEVHPISVDSIKSLTINTIFSLIFLTIYATAFIALFVALLVRVVVLWISIAISPLSFLGMAFESVKAKFGDDDPFFKLFMKHALVPLPVALILTVGMIMIAQLKQISPGAQFSTNPADLGAITSGMSTIQDLIAGLATAAFIWIAAFKAMSGTQADKFINPIKGAVEGFGKNLAKLPLYAPILPVDGGKKVGLASITSGLNTPGEYIRKRQEEDRIATGDKKGQALSQLDAAKNSPEASKKAIAEVIRSGQADGNKEVQAKIAELMEKHKDQMKNLVLPIAYSNNQEKFLTDLKAGSVKKDDLSDFVTKNKDRGFHAAPPEAAKAIEEGREAARKASSTGAAASMPALAQPLKDLNSKLQELDKEKATGNDRAITKASAEVTAATAKVEKLNKAFEQIGGITPSNIIDQTGRVTNTGKGVAGDAQALYKGVEDTEKPAAREALIKKFAQHLAGGDNTTLRPEDTLNATTIVDQIIANGSGVTGLTSTASTPPASGTSPSPTAPPAPPSPPSGTPSSP